MFLVILKLFLVSLIPVFCAAALIVVKLHTNFKNWNKWLQFLLVVGVFGATSIVGTLLSVKSPTGAAINVRDASPIIAGLVFGGPMGIAVGFIGGIFRFVAAYWDPALRYTQIACSVACVFAGVFTALIRRYIFNNHHGKWYYGIFIAILVEDFHMLLVFLTNMKDISGAYAVVKACVGPMMLTNSLAVAIASIVACAIAKERFFRMPGKIKMGSKVQIALTGSLLVAYVAVSLFTFGSLKNISVKNMNQSFQTTISDVKSSVDLEVNNVVSNELGLVKDKLQIVLDDPANNSSNLDAKLTEKLGYFGVSEVNLVDNTNHIVYTTHPAYKSYDMTSQEQSNLFTSLTSSSEPVIQEYGKVGYGDQEAKYAGAQISNSNFPDVAYFQIGYDSEAYHNLLDSKVTDCAKYRHIGEKGFIVVANNDYEIKSTSDISPLHTGEVVDSSKIHSGTKPYEFEKDKNKYSYYTYEIYAQGYHIIAFGEKAENDLSMKVGFMGITLTEVFVFMILYFVLFLEIKKNIVNRIEHVSEGLREISSGNLDVVIDERNSLELDSLSTDINKTVDALKENARKEAEKIEEELKYAKSIQHSALPTVFPKNNKFELFASMDAAKEVGGDFYDFYFVDREHIAIQIADVSGKGIPAAMFMMQAKSIIKNYVESGMPVNEAYTEANKELCAHNEAQMFVTAWLAVINLSTGHVDFVNAGHNPPLIKRDGKFEYLKGKAGFVLAGFDGFEYKLQSFDIKPGDAIYLYTDGVTEAMNVNKELYGETRLLEEISKSMRKPENICKNVINSVKFFAGEAEQSDDITMLCFELKEKESSDMIEVDAKIENGPKVTDFVNKFLEKHGAEKKAMAEIDVAIDELYSNICYYAYKEGELGKAKIIVDFDKKDKAVLTFEDRGIPYNPLEKQDPSSLNASIEDREIGGLGIFIVKKTMDKIEYSRINGSNVLKITKTIK